MTSSGCMISFFLVWLAYCVITATLISFPMMSWNQFIWATYCFAQKKCSLQLLSSRWQDILLVWHMRWRGFVITTNMFQCKKHPVSWIGPWFIEEANYEANTFPLSLPVQATWPVFKVWTHINKHVRNKNLNMCVFKENICLPVKPFD